MRRIGIVGAAIGQDELLERGKGYELWSVNNLYAGFPDVKFGRWFELHAIGESNGEMTRRNFNYYPIHSEQTIRQYMDKLDELGIPVMMQRKWKHIEKSEIFPFDEIMKRHGTYFGCSFAWMVAYALLLGDVEQIGFFGMNFESVEYYYQRPSLERMIGYAEGRGINIYMDETSGLLKGDYIYALKENFDLIYLLHGQFIKEMAAMFTVGLSDRLARAIVSPEGREI